MHVEKYVEKCHKYCRSHSNFEEAKSTESEEVASAAGVQQVEDASANENEEVTTPDDMVVREIDSIENCLGNHNSLKVHLRKHLPEGEKAAAAHQCPTCAKSHSSVE